MFSTALRHRVHYIDCRYLEQGRGRREVTRLGRVYAFPTTIRVDRKGKVRKVHTALSEPVTGDHFEGSKKEFTTSIEQLLTEI